ncbi:UDP-N-acetylmuramoyl-L-alanine--D-glutamate ligase [Candidatus Oscillochloris fontis]|uniref:UDP-N-acetylmuramoyl-L-alanine--D-glutamate ligase n=1 Tax=Candidatus Oscillochloris fontis TaxID=2496868 RepID=UPI001EE80937|nr:UDP-N-acetylmuramoyl-L-alanine--D-glutamate ligase [Candidatus Oscillochloris fontis]
MINLTGQSVLVMGLGVHGGGLGVARWLLAQGARVTVTDMATPEALAVPVAHLNAAAAQLGTEVHYTLGEHHAEDFINSDMVVVNPAVRPTSPWLKLCQDLGVPIETEMTLFFRACPGPILGVTGTKGKTTTSLMLAAMLREAYPDTLAAGNLRVSALEALPNLTPETPVVLELSSFQLERIGAVGLSPRFSLITNLSGDHINWHGSFGAYAQAKRQIFAHQHSDGVVVLPATDVGPESLIWPLAEGYAGRMIVYDAHPGAPTEAHIDAAGNLRLGALTLAHCDDIHLAGMHNRSNALAAAALAYSFGVSAAQIARALCGFMGVEHRLERVRELDGVIYVNDTTATNPAATLAALEAITTPIILIAGGADKELAFADLGAAIARRVKALVLLEGSATPRLHAAIAHAALLNPHDIHGPYADFQQAIAVARGLAEVGDTVLLSPGCASFGMFRNEFHRGEEFRRIVQALE